MPNSDDLRKAADDLRRLTPHLPSKYDAKDEEDALVEEAFATGNLDHLFSSLVKWMGKYECS